MMKTFLIGLLFFGAILQAREINIDKLIDKASSTQKHLFIFLHKNNCGYCESMEEFTLQNKIIQAFIKKHFIYEHININEKDHVAYQSFYGNGREFAREIGYEFYPTSLFFDDKAELILAEAGYKDSEKNPNENRFYKILNFIQSKFYEKMYISDYKFDEKRNFNHNE